MARRASRMSAPELAHRIVEQLKMAQDRRRAYGWTDFDGAGAVDGLQGLWLHKVDAELLKAAAEESAAVLNGDLRLLGQRWPKRLDTWWDSDLWGIDPRTGRPWPGGDRFAFDAPYRDGAGEVKFVWELNRLPMAPALALHAAATGDSSPVFALLRGWMAANPPFRGVGWAGGVEAAHRVVALLAALAFIAPKTGEDGVMVRRFLGAHAFWIARYPSRFSSANNHRVAELAALFLIGLSAPALAVDAETARLRRRLEHEVERQFHPDGVGSEQSPAYAALSLEWLTLAAAEGEARGRPFSPAFRRRAAQAADALDWLIDAGGRTPRIGDADESRVLPFRLAPEPDHAASVVAMTRRWLGQPQALSKGRSLRDRFGPPTPSAARPTGLRTFADGGLSVWRAPRADGDLLLVFDHGPLGQGAIAAHGHADALAVWLHWGVEAVFVDAGSHLYHGGGALRDAMRGTAAHNTLMVEGVDQSRIIGPFAWSRRARVRGLARGDDWVEAAHDGYRRRFGVEHRRRVTARGETILIEDWLDGGLARDWTLGFTLAPAIEVQADGAVARLRAAAGRRLTLVAETGGDWELSTVPYSPEFGALETTSRLSLGGRGLGPVARVRITLHQQSPT